MSRECPHTGWQQAEADGAASLALTDAADGLLIDRLGVASYQHSADISGASDQRIFILRRDRLTVAVSNETDHITDLSH